MAVQALSLFLTAKLIPFIYAIVGFSALIAIHECGHFLFCKLFGIHTPTFSIGFGPEIFRKKIGSTDFRLAIIPLGGYVEIAGLAEVGQGEQAHAHVTGSSSFDDKPYWQKLLVLSGGIIFNLIFAYMVFCGLFMLGSSGPQGVIVAGIVKDSAAEKAGLLPGDAIVQVNDDKLKDDAGSVSENASDILLQHIRSNPHKTIVVKVERKQEIIEIPVTLGAKIEANKEIGSLGANLGASIQRLPLFQAIAQGVKETNRWIYQIVLSVKRLITQRSLEGAGGPVMIMSMSFASAQHGLMQLLTFLALISINLALMNLLPIGALDGGQILFVTIEAIIGRKLPVLLRNSINIASWLFFIGLALFLTYRDIATLFGDKIVGLYNKILGLIR